MSDIMTKFHYKLHRALIDSLNAALTIPLSGPSADHIDKCLRTAIQIVFDDDTDVQILEHAFRYRLLRDLLLEAGCPIESIDDPDKVSAWIKDCHSLTVERAMQFIINHHMRSFSLPKILASIHPPTETSNWSSIFGQSK